MKPVLIFLAFLIPLAAVGVLRPGLNSSTVDGDSVRMPSPTQWAELVFELEDELSARALLGGVQDDRLDLRLEQMGISWEGYRRRAKELIREAGRAEQAQDSNLILEGGLSQLDIDEAIEFTGSDEAELEISHLDYEIIDLVRRLILRLPAES